MVAQPLKLRADLLAEIREIPGVRHGGSGWTVPPDVRRIFGLPEVDLQVRDWQIPCTWHDARAYQQDDLEFLRKNGGGIIAHPTSGGKTFIGLAFGDAIPGPCLIVGPAMSRFAWMSEVKKWMPHRTIYIAKGRTPDPAALDHDFVFCGLEVITHWGHTLGQQQWTSIIFDEIHELRTRQTGRNQGVREAIGLSLPVMCGLSATPQWNAVSDLWNILALIRPGWFGGKGTFRIRYAGAVPSMWDGLVDNRATNAPEFRQRMRHTIRRLPKSELLPDLPPLRRSTIKVHSPDSQARMHDAAVSAFGEANDDKTLKRLLDQIARRETPEKITDLLKVAEGHNRIVVMTQIREAAEMVARKMEEASWPVVTFHGAQTIPRRLKLVAKARKMDRVAVVCTGPSVRQSVDCTGFDGLVFLEFPWTAEELIQNEGRCHRHGVDTPIDVYYIVIDSSFDSHNVDLILRKLADRRAMIGEDDSDAGITQSLREPPDLRSVLRRLGIS